MNNKRKTVSPSFQSPRAGRAFTMIEMLVVMFVIGMLLTIGVPIALKIRTEARINNCRVSVNTIDVAIDMYQKQHKRYPELETMVSTLIGLAFTGGGETPQGVAIPATEVPDSQPGVGYRLQPRGPVYGPWNGVDKLFRSGDYKADEDAARVHFLDAFGSRIWYCPFNGTTYADIKFEATNSEMNVTIANIADYAKDKPPSVSTGKFYRRDYIVMSQSADSQWGLIRGATPPAGGSQSAADVIPTDDVTNFGQ